METYDSARILRDIRLCLLKPNREVRTGMHNGFSRLNLDTLGIKEEMNEF